MNEKTFDFKKFIDDSKETLLNPKSYFASMKLDGGMGEPIIKALIYSVIAGVFYLIWSFLAVGGVAGGLLGGAAGIGAFFVTIIGGVIGVFIGALLILIVSSICNGNNDFEACLRVSASIMVIFPVSALFSVLQGVNFYLGSIVGLAINLYSLYLLYLAITLALKGKEQTAKIVSYVLAGLIVLFLIIGLAGGAALRHGYKMGSSSFEKELRKMEEQMAEASDEMQTQYDDAETETNEKYERPEEFPAKALGEVQNALSTGKAVLSTEKLQRLIDATAEIKGYNQEQTDEINNVLTSHGYSGILEYSTDMIAAASGFAAVSSLWGMEKYEKMSDAEKKNAGMFEMDKMLKAAASQSISMAKLTEKDLYTIYKNWDMVVEIEKNTKK